MSRDSRRSSRLAPQVSGKMRAALERSAERERQRAEAAADEPYRLKRQRASQHAFDFYAARKLLEPHQVRAGELFAAHKLGSGLDQRVTGRYEVSSGRSSPPGFAPGPTFFEWTRVNAYLDQQEFSLLYWVVIEGRSAGDWCERTGRKRDQAMGRLHSALDRLAYHYKLVRAKDLVLRHLAPSPPVRDPSDAA